MSNFCADLFNGIILPAMWLFFSFLTALFQSISDLLSKIALRKQGIFSVALLKLLMPVPLLFLFYPHIPHDIPSDLWKILIVLVPLDVTATVLYQISIKTAPLSLSLPLLAFSPVFILVTGWVILGENPSGIGKAGVLLVGIGAYILNLEKVKKGLFEPIFAIFRYKGTFLMFVVAIIYSINSVLGKKAVLLVNPLFFSWFYFLILSLVLFPISLFFENPVKNWKKTPVLSVAIAVTYGLMIVFHFQAVRLVDVAYMISVKRFSLVLGSLWGVLFLGEGFPARRIIGSLIMFVGVVLIVVGGG